MLRADGSDVALGSELESSLLERLRAKDPEAYVELLKRLGGRMLAVARRMLNNEEDARDAVQEAMLACCKHVDTFDGRSQVGTWQHRIVVNACLMKRRSRSRRPERSLRICCRHLLTTATRAGAVHRGQVKKRARADRVRSCGRWFESGSTSYPTGIARCCF